MMKPKHDDYRPGTSQRCGIAAVIAFALVASISSQARGQDEEAVNRAYDLAAQGLAAYNSGNYSAALERFNRAFDITPLPALALHMARANVKLSHFVAAMALYRQAMQLGDGIGDSQVQARARTEAQSEVAELTARIPRLRISVSGAPSARVNLLVDGVRVPLALSPSELPVDPGQHSVIATYGAETQHRYLTLREGEATQIQLLFDQIKSAPVLQSKPVFDAQERSTHATETLTWIGYGVGGTGLLISGITGLAALSNKHRADDTGCNREPRWSSCDEGSVTRYSTLRTIAGVSFYTGVASVITATALHLGTPRQKNSRGAKRPVLPWVGLESAGIEGSF